MLALGCTAAPKTIAEFVLKGRSRFVLGALHAPARASSLTTGAFTRFKRFLTEQHCTPYRDFLHRKIDAARISVHDGTGQSNDEVEAEFGARRAETALIAEN
ncbi:antitoxin of toxin-antitoxin stability system [Pseudomonas sp. FW300-N1A1]|uniref:antitoxin of toxin-antitoxin stability system n=1 Tax=Pseudomonas sp. FW300-N1A1 TaxID=2075555 RepID=UPI0011AED5DD|nr:antitoxin of toxin-antitoxin stability system [Pseudomonas sp. FW300-N1A1]